MTAEKNNKAADQASTEAARGWAGSHEEPAAACETTFILAGKDRDDRQLYKQINLVPWNDKPGQSLFVEAPKKVKVPEPTAPDNPEPTAPDYEHGHAAHAASDES